MFFGMSVLAALAGMQGVASLTPLQHIKISRQNILVSDVVRADSVDQAVFKRVADKVIATLPEDRSSIELSRTALVNLVRRRVPLFSEIVIGSKAKNIRIENISYTLQSSPQPRNNSDCKKTLRPVASGAIIFSDNLISVPCTTKLKTRNLTYNQLTGVLRATSDLGAGTYMATVKIPEGRFVDSGDELVLRIAIGAIRVERPVWAIQPTNGAKYIFVTDVDGELMRVPVYHPNRKTGGQDGE